MRAIDREQLHRERGARLCVENRWTHYCLHPNGRDACIAPLLFTFAILADLDHFGYGERWCYHTYTDARRALDAWDGEGEPDGWHRHPNSGRRRQYGNPKLESIDK